MGKKCYQCYNESNEPCESCPALRCIKTGKTEYKLVSWPPGSQTQWIELFCYPIKDSISGEVTGVVEFARDITERKRAEHALSEAEQRYRTIADFTYDWETWEDPDGTFRYISPSCKRITGYEAGKFMNDPDLLSRLILPEDHQIWTRHKQDVTEKAILQEIQFRIRRADGEIRWIEHACRKVTDQQGVFLGYRGSNRDITDRKQAEQERLDSLHFLESMDRINQALIETKELGQMMSDVLDVVLSIFECDRAWFVYPCDPDAATWRAPMERTRPEYPGALILDLEMPVDSEVVRVYNAVLASDEPVGFGPGNELPLPAAIAEKFNEQSQLSMAIYPKVDKPYMFGIHQCSRPRAWTPEERRLLKEIGRRLADVLTGLLIYQELHKSEQQYRDLIEKEKDIIYTLDDKGYITFTSPAVETVLGYFSEELKGRHFVYLIPEEWQEKTKNDFNKLIKTGEITAETVLLNKTGETHFVEYSSTVIKEDDKVVGTRGIIRDITERNKTEEKLRASEERLQLTLQVTQIGIFDWDVVNDRWYASPEYYTMLGYEPKEGMADREEWLARVHPDDRAHVEAKIRRVLARDPLVDSSDIYEYEARLRHFDGSYRWLYIKGFAWENG